ncbi:hypothetical protein [Cupriavidus sp. TMH.W2]|uniref:hypothetical protein n=1 Tax=Cupriavidus sp. TMH.W2 TaxID=3434465 RepID=UPI003D76AA89
MAWTLLALAGLFEVVWAAGLWAGIGAAGTAIPGIILFNEPATAARLGCIGLIVCGFAGLKLIGSA